MGHSVVCIVPSVVMGNQPRGPSERTGSLSPGHVKLHLYTDWLGPQSAWKKRDIFTVIAVFPVVDKLDMSGCSL